jgi:hypothetical protein
LVLLLPKLLRVVLRNLNYFVELLLVPIL